MDELAAPQNVLERSCAFVDQISRVSGQIQLLGLQLSQLVNEYVLSETPAGQRRFVGDELAMALDLSPRQGQALVLDAQILCSFPAMTEQVASGRWSLKHAWAALDGIAGSGLTPGQEAEALAMVAGQGQARTPWQVRKAVAAAALVLNPEAAAARHEKAKQDRCVYVGQYEQGIGMFTACGTPSAVHSLMTAIDCQLGPTGPEDDRSLAQRRFDLLTDLVCGRAEPGQWQAYVLMTLETLTGASDAPAEIPGLGLISAQEARELAGNAALRRVVVDEHGELVNVDSVVHQPPADDVEAPEPSAMAERLWTRQAEPADLDEDHRAPQHTHAGADAAVAAGAVPDEADRAWAAAQADAAHAAAETEAAYQVLLLSPSAFEAAVRDLLRTELAAVGVDLDTQLAHTAALATAGLRPPTEYPAFSGLIVEVDPDPFTPTSHSTGCGWDRPAPGPPWRPRQGPPDQPPTPGDLGWEHDTTNYRSYATTLPQTRYEREPGPDPNLLRPPPPPAWTATAMTAALTQMLTAKISAAPGPSSSYALPPRMARHVKTRDATCTFPGCPKLAQTCQNDHITPWPQGPTCVSNVASDCTHHHQGKTERFFTVTRDPGGTLHWTVTRTGYTVSRGPRPLLRGW